MMSQMEGGCPLDYNTITDLFLQVGLYFFSFLLLFLEEGEDFFSWDIFLDGGEDSMYFLNENMHTIFSQAVP